MISGHLPPTSRRTEKETSISHLSKLDEWTTWTYWIWSRLQIHRKLPKSMIISCLDKSLKVSTLTKDLWHGPKTFCSAHEHQEALRTRRQVRTGQFIRQSFFLCIQNATWLAVKMCHQTNNQHHLSNLNAEREERIRRNNYWKLSRLALYLQWYLITVI